MDKAKPQESGILVPLLAICVVTLFILLGLAIDGGRLYYARLETQTAADAAAFSAAAMISMNNTDFSAININPIVSQAKIAGVHMAIQNLRLNSKDTTARSATVEVTTPGGTIVVTAEVEERIPLHFMRVLPNQGSDKKVRAVARSEITPTLGVVALDSSGSMNCPASSTDPDERACKCFPNCGSDAGKRFTALLKIVDEAFLKKFDRERDQISVMMYDKTTEEIVSIVPGGGFVGDLSGPKVVQYTADTKEFDVTNITLAILHAWDILKPVFADEPDRYPFIALLSDGAPSATCMDPVDVKSSKIPDFAGRKSCLWELIWEGFHEDSIKDDINPIKLDKEGISRIGRAPTYKDVPAWGQVDPPFDPAPCSKLTFEPWAAKDNRGKPEDAEDEVGKCWDSYRFRDMDGKQYPVTAPLNSPTDAPVNEVLPSGTKSGVDQWRRLFYHTAIAEADAIRGRNVAFFTIGLGYTTSTSDAYNDLKNLLGRKDNLLGRIALPYKVGTPFQNPSGTIKWDSSWGDVIGNNNQPKGEYFPVTDLDDAALAEKFKYLAARVKLRVVR